MKSVIKIILILTAILIPNFVYANISITALKKTIILNNQLKQNFTFGGIVNDMILLIDPKDSDNNIYVKENTILESGCIVTKTGIKCEKETKIPEKQKVIVSNNNCLEIKDILKIIDFNAIQTHSYPFIGEIKEFKSNKKTYLFANIQQEMLLDELFKGSLYNKIKTDKYTIFVINENTLLLPEGNRK